MRHRGSITYPKVILLELKEVDGYYLARFQVDVGIFRQKLETREAFTKKTEPRYTMGSNFKLTPDWYDAQTGQHIGDVCVPLERLVTTKLRLDDFKCARVQAESRE